jgi:hypothetical protein
MNRDIFRQAVVGVVVFAVVIGLFLNRQPGQQFITKLRAAV